MRTPSLRACLCVSTFGRWRTSHLFSLRSSWVAFALRFGWCADYFGWIWAESRAVYTSQFILLSAVTSSINTRGLVSLAALHAHTLTLPLDHEQFLSFSILFSVYHSGTSKPWLCLSKDFLQACAGSFRCFLVKCKCPSHRLVQRAGLHLVVNAL